MAVVAGALDVAELDLMQRVVAQDVRFKVDFQQLAALVPVHACVHLDAVVAEPHSHLSFALAKGIGDDQIRLAFPGLPDRAGGLQIAVQQALAPVAAHLPAVVDNLNILVQPPVIHLLARIHQGQAVALVDDLGDRALPVHRNTKEAVLHAEAIRRFCNGCGCKCRLRSIR